MGQAVTNTRGPVSENRDMASMADVGGADGLRLTLSKAEAAAALGVSVDFFEDHVMHDLRIVRIGRRRLVPIQELVRWLDDNASRALGD
jgi:excisionase family DNA binding protein